MRLVDDDELLPVQVVGEKAKPCSFDRRAKKLGRNEAVLAEYARVALAQSILFGDANERIKAAKVVLDQYKPVPRTESQTERKIEIVFVDVGSR